MSTRPDRTSITRVVRVGERLTLDGGRIVIEVMERSGRNASRIRLDMAADVVLHKPGPSITKESAETSAIDG